MWSAFKNRIKGLGKAVGCGLLAAGSYFFYIPVVIPVAVVTAGLSVGLEYGWKAGFKAALAAAAAPVVLSVEAVCGVTQFATGYKPSLIREIANNIDPERKSRIEFEKQNHVQQQYHSQHQQETIDQQQQYIEALRNQQAPQQNIAERLSLQHDGQGLEMQDMKPNLYSPAENFSHHQVALVAKSSTFEEARDAYVAQSFAPEVKKFEVANRIELEGGLTEITYVPPGMDPKTCPSDKKVVQTFDKNGDVVEVKTGDRATCIAPPVKQQDGSFKLHGYRDGQVTDLVQHHRDIQQKRDAMIVHDTGNFGQSLPHQRQSLHQR